MQETAWEAGVPARTALGELTALPQLMGRGLTAPSHPTAAFGLSGLACPRPLIFKPSPN